MKLGAPDRVRQSRRALRPRHLVLLFALVLGSCAPAPAASPAAPAPATTGPVAQPAATAAQPAATAAQPETPPAAQAPPPLNPPVSLKVGSLRLVGEAGLMAALGKGYFREEGLDVDLVPFRTTNEQTAPLATGELQLGSVGPDPSLFNAMQRGIELKIVGYNAIISDHDTSGGFLVRQDLLDSGAYKEFKDLKGTTLPVSLLGGLGQVWIERVLAKGNLTLDDVTLTTITFPDMPAAFANKAIDAAFMVEPFVTVAEAQGTAKNVLPSGQIYPGLVAMVLLMSPVFAREQPEAAQRFVTAYLRGQRDYYRAFVQDQGGKEEIFQYLQQYTPVADPHLLPRMTTHIVDPNGVMDPRTLNELQDAFVRYGTQQQKVDLGRVIDGAYAERAVQRLGRAAP
ncbi:MAG TPA: ABC transporter substrate-binding protein [Chloroflexota bacterium]|nr:ABC transporter substrate-binding protein [Chloroflexota bacterium]